MKKNASESSKANRAYLWGWVALVFLTTAVFVTAMASTDLGPILAYAGSINIAAFLLCGYDKSIAAVSYRRDSSGLVGQVMRIPEMVLLTAALIGGSLGLLIGMSMFRHKTRKAGFLFILFVIGVAQALLLKKLLG